jgi:hypothetical protein
MTRSALRFLLAMSMFAGAGCHKRTQIQAKAAVVAQADGPPAPGSNKQGEGNGTGAGLGANADEDLDNPNQRFHEATVYVDGVPKIAFTYNEMPPSVPVYEYTWGEEGDSDKAHHMLVADYLKALGVNLKKVKEAHFYGGRDRVVVVTGDELRKHAKDFYFNFTRDFLGKPRGEWKPGLHTNDKVDISTDLAVYVNKKPPHWDKENWSLVDDKGQPITEEIPYCADEMPRRSVRVNVDGIYVAYLKRNLLEGNLQPVNEVNGEVPKTEMPRYKLNELLAKKNIPTSAFRGMDLITRDERIIRISPTDAADVEFTLQRHGGGIAEFSFKGVKAYAKAVNVYVKLAPPNRPMRTYTLGGVGRQARRGGGESQLQVVKPQ